MQDINLDNNLDNMLANVRASEDAGASDHALTARAIRESRGRALREALEAGPSYKRAILDFVSDASQYEERWDECWRANIFALRGRLGEVEYAMAELGRYREQHLEFMDDPNGCAVIARRRSVRDAYFSIVAALLKAGDEDLAQLAWLNVLDKYWQGPERWHRDSINGKKICYQILRGKNYDTIELCDALETESFFHYARVVHEVVEHAPEHAPYVLAAFLLGHENADNEERSTLAIIDHLLTKGCCAEAASVMGLRRKGKWQDLEHIERAVRVALLGDRGEHGEAVAVAREMFIPRASDSSFEPPELTYHLWALFHLSNIYAMRGDEKLAERTIELAHETALKHPDPIQSDRYPLRLGIVPFASAQCKKFYEDIASHNPELGNVYAEDNRIIVVPPVSNPWDDYIYFLFMRDMVRACAAKIALESPQKARAFLDEALEHCPRERNDDIRKYAYLDCATSMVEGELKLIG